MRAFKIYIFTVLFLFSLHPFAKSYEYTGACKFSGSTMAFESCLNKELSTYDKELNAMYRNLLKSTANKKFKKAEQLWIKFKEEDCDYMAHEVNEGRDYLAIRLVCLINKTKERIVDLKDHIFIRVGLNKLFRELG